MRERGSETQEGKDVCGLKGQGREGRRKGEREGESGREGRLWAERIKEGGREGGRASRVGVFTWADSVKSRQQRHQLLSLQLCCSPPADTLTAAKLNLAAPNVRA